MTKIGNVIKAGVMVLFAGSSAANTAIEAIYADVNPKQRSASADLQQQLAQRQEDILQAGLMAIDILDKGQALKERVNNQEWHIAKSTLNALDLVKKNLIAQLKFIETKIEARKCDESRCAAMYQQVSKLNEQLKELEPQIERYQKLFDAGVE